MKELVEKYQELKWMDQHKKHRRMRFLYLMNQVINIAAEMVYLIFGQN